jgi:hypothetical protein
MKQLVGNNPDNKIEPHAISNRKSGSQRHLINTAWTRNSNEKCHEARQPPTIYFATLPWTARSETISRQFCSQRSTLPCDLHTPQPCPFSHNAKQTTTPKKQVFKQLKSPSVPRPLAFISRHIIYPSSLISGPALASLTPMSIIVMPWCESCFSCVERYVDVCLQEGTDAVYGQASLDVYLSFS